MPLELGWATDPGRVHPLNEDSYALFHATHGGVLLVCDGMGGMGRGDEASQLAVHVIYQYLHEADLEPSAALAESLRRADYAIRRRLCSSGRTRPGATAASAYVTRDGIQVCWIGDSPTFWLRGADVMRRTRDDKLVEDLVDRGEITRAEAANSPLSSVLTKALGGRPPSPIRVEPSLEGEVWQLQDGDCIVICSDGLADLVSGPEIAEVTSTMDPTDACSELVRLANSRGGHDNITVIVGRWGGETRLDTATSNTDITPAIDGVDDHATDPHGLALQRDTIPPDLTPAPAAKATFEMAPLREAAPPDQESDAVAAMTAAATMATLLAGAVAAATLF